MSERVQDTVIRFAVIFILILLMFCAVIGRIIYIQTVQHKLWLEIADRQTKNVSAIKPIRGNIYDEEGRLLASSTPQYYVRMDTRVEALHLKGGELLYAHVDEIAQGLSQIIGDEDASVYKKHIMNAWQKHKDIKISRKRINYLQKKQINQLPLIKRGYYKSGFYFEDINLRDKPYGSLGSRTIGSIYGADGHGNAGLERKFDEYLCGTEGRAIRQKVAGVWTDVPTVEAKNGYDLITTLDANLMDIVESTLRERLNATEADWGCCILMEVASGEIKAISNLDRGSDGNYYERMNHAVTRVEPGSTFKTISLMAALDDDKIDLYDTLRVYKNGWTYINSKHTDSHPKDTSYTIRSALAVSSNIAFAKLVTQSYDKKAERFVDKLQKMGITEGFECEIPGADKPLIQIPKDKVTLSKMAYGYSVELSPMQILAFYNGIANNGKMIRPYLVKRIEKEGSVVEEFDTKTLKSSLCKSSTLKDVKQALHDVVWDNDLGTASVLKWNGRIVRYKAQSEKVHIAGKTGTAQLLENGHYQGRKHRMTFVGYFPEENPQYTCICMINHPHNYGAYDAGADCGKVVRIIAEKTMAYTGILEWEHGQYVWKKVK